MPEKPECRPVSICCSTRSKAIPPAGGLSRIWQITAACRMIRSGDFLSNIPDVCRNCMWTGTSCIAPPNSLPIHHAASVPLLKHSDIRTLTIFPADSKILWGSPLNSIVTICCGSCSAEHSSGIRAQNGCGKFFAEKSSACAYCG